MTDEPVETDTETETRLANVPMMSNLAPELVLRIFGELELGEATCLGVTCRRFYNMLKAGHPGPIDLRTEVIFNFPKACKCCGPLVWGWMNLNTLSQRLREWIGPRYKMRLVGEPLRPLYLNVAVYGCDEDVGKDPNERRLMNRYLDYDRVSNRSHCSISQA